MKSIFSSEYKRGVIVAVAIFVLCFSTFQVHGFSNSRYRPLSVSKIATKQPLTFGKRPSTYMSKESGSETCLFSSSNDNNGVTDVEDPFFDISNIPKFVGGQSVLILVAIAAASVLNVPNYGLGEGFSINSDAIITGVLGTLPLGLLAVILDKLEPYVKQLQDVTKATQRSVLAILGGKFKPGIALGTSIMLGAAAGIGEEMLFRGVMQGELSLRFGDNIALLLSSIVFGLGHAVTPFYALLATLASLFFGSLYISSHNLAVPIVCHGLYDVGALMWAHYNVTSLDFDEQNSLMVF